MGSLFTVGPGWYSRTGERSLLTAITAAVAGVILNLAQFFGYHVLWPGDFAGAFDWASALIALAAAIALFRFKRNVIHVIATCAMAGLILKLLMP